LKGIFIMPLTREMIVGYAIELMTLRFTMVDPSTRIVDCAISGSALDQLRTRLHARKVAPLYGSVDPDVHRPAPPESDFAGDLSYLQGQASRMARPCQSRIGIPKEPFETGVDRMVVRNATRSHATAVSEPD